MQHQFARGFSLLEMLVSLGILTIIVLLMSTVFKQTQISWLYASERLDAEMAGRALLQQMATELTQAICSTGMPLSCSGNSITYFTTVTPPSTNTPCEIRKVRYELTSTGVINGLTRSEKYCGSTGWPGGSFDGASLLASNQVTSLTFECATVSGSFSSGWSSYTDLPAAVRIKLGLVGTRTAAKLSAMGSVSARLTNEYAVILSTIANPRNAPLN